MVPRLLTLGVLLLGTGLFRGLEPDFAPLDGSATPLVVGLFLVAGVLAGQLARDVGLPRISGCLVLGVLAGPDALGLVGMQITPSAHPEVKKVKWINPLLADPVPANIGTLQEGRYPFKMGLYYYTIADRTDLASGFLSFMAGNQGQRLVADNGFLPAMIPVRIVNLSPYGDQK